MQYHVNRNKTFPKYYQTIELKNKQWKGIDTKYIFLEFNQQNIYLLITTKDKSECLSFYVVVFLYVRIRLRISCLISNDKKCIFKIKVNIIVKYNKQISENRFQKCFKFVVKQDMHPLRCKLHKIFFSTFYIAIVSSLLWDFSVPSSLSYFRWMKPYLLWNKILHETEKFCYAIVSRYCHHNALF